MVFAHQLSLISPAAVPKKKKARRQRDKRAPSLRQTSPWIERLIAETLATAGQSTEESIKGPIRPETSTKSTTAPGFTGKSTGLDPTTAGVGGDIDGVDKLLLASARVEEISRGVAFS